MTLFGQKFDLLSKGQVLHIIAVFWLFAFLLIWHHLAADELTILAIVWLFSFVLGSYLVGDLFLKMALNDCGKFKTLPTKLLVGILCLNFCLFFMSLIFPVGLSADWILLLIFVLVICAKTRKRNFKFAPTKNPAPEIIFFLTIPLVITLWCIDLLRPMMLIGNVEVIRSWQDIFYHLCEINSFALSKGMGTISDVQMSGAPINAYHMASYILPATLVSFAGSSTLVSYASLLVPLGLLMTTLAAFSLIQIVFGKGPALAASLALVLLPDAGQQGFGNLFFGYQWLLQIAPASGYGIASATFGFALLFQGCKTNQFKFVFFGYIFAFLTLLYKAQIFVAISFPALIFPALFMGGRVAKNRVHLIVALTVVYIIAVLLAQTSLSVPIMRLDGTGLYQYSSMIVSLQADGLIKHLVGYLFRIDGDVWILRAITFLVMLILCTFGVYPLIYLFLKKYLRHNFQSAVWLFPLIVVAVYLIMSICMALDDRHIGTPEELLHRPFVWAYFILAIWCSAATYHKYFGNSLPTSNREKWILCLTFLALLVIPIYFNKGIQSFEMVGKNYQKLPVCQVNSARFIKENSFQNEIIQDSKNDPQYVLTALSERKSFAIDSGGFRQPSNIQYRLAILRDLKGFDTSEKVEVFMKENGINWYLVNPDENIHWESYMESHKAFECDGYKLYKYPNKS